MKKWDFNEVLMLVDCYNRIVRKKAEATSSGVLESYFDEEATKLSAVLRRREIEQHGEIDDRFRNVTGIKMKLRNIEYLATSGKSGLDNYSAMDKKGYELFMSNPDLFAELVAALKVAYKAENIDEDSIDSIDAWLEDIADGSKTSVPTNSEPVGSALQNNNPTEPNEAEAVPETPPIDNGPLLPEDVPFFERYHLHPDAFSDLLIEDAQLSVRTLNCLRRGKITHIDTLLKKTASELCSIRNFGKKCLEEIETYMVGLASCSSQRNDEPVAVSTVAVSNVQSDTSILMPHKTSIFLGDFSFADSIDLDENGKKQLMLYQEAFECIGDELAYECYANPGYICSIAEALYSFYTEMAVIGKRRASLLELVRSLPDGRAEKDAYGFIMAYSRDAEKREELISLCPVHGCSLKELVVSVDLSDIAVYSKIEKFIYWCAFDVNKELDSLYEKLFRQPRYRSILEMRASNKTLEATGNAHGLTRERIRQLELKSKRVFNSWHSRSRIIYKVAALSQGNAALTPVELAEFFGDNTNILIFLLKSISDSGFSYDEQTDAFYLGDDNFADRLQNALEELPSIITKKKLNEIVSEASDSSDIPESVIEKAIIDSYRLTGDTYHRSSLTLRKVYESILEKYYPDGILVYSDHELARFRELVQHDYGDINLPDNNRAISARLAALCILCGRGKYKLRKGDCMPKALATKIYKYIQASPHSVIMTNTIFSVFEDELCACGIDNKYYLQGSLREIYGEQFIFRRDYVSKDSSVTNLYVEIVKFVKSSRYPVSKPEVFKEFPGVSEIVINIALSDPDVINYFGAYLHSSNLRISMADKHYLKEVVKGVLSDGTSHHGKDIYEIIEKEQPELLQRHGLFTAFSLFSVLEYLFRENYEFDRPYIAPQGVAIDKAGDKLREMVLESDEILIADIASYAKENRYVIYSLLDYVLSFGETHLMRNYETLTTISLLGVDADIAKRVESIISEEISCPIPIAQLQCIYRLPKIGVQWNEWLIYSVINKWGTRLQVGTSSPQYRYAVPIIGPFGSVTKESLESFSDLQQSTILQPDNLDNIDDLIADIIFDE